MTDKMIEWQINQTQRVDLLNRELLLGANDSILYFAKNPEKFNSEDALLISDMLMAIEGNLDMVGNFISTWKEWWFDKCSEKSETESDSNS